MLAGREIPYKPRSHDKNCCGDQAPVKLFLAGVAWNSRCPCVRNSSRRATYWRVELRLCAPNKWQLAANYQVMVKCPEMETEKVIRPTEPTPSTGGKPDEPAGMLDPERWVEAYGDHLFRYALMRLRNPARAEDLVQEVFLAALRSQHSFQGRSAEKSWLVGILKNKIRNYYRTASRETPFTDLDFYADEESDRFVSDGLFEGGWIHALGPAPWPPEPGESLDRAEFWNALRECTDRLPTRIAQVFLMRERDEIDCKEMCEVLNITENNLWVMLHRARMALRRCLETNWFSKL